MDYMIQPGQRSGFVRIPASKSFAHRFLICAALSKKTSGISCDGISKDIMATVECLRSMGAGIDIRENYIETESVSLMKKGAQAEAAPEEGMTGRHGTYIRLNCGESGSTLRFLLPVAAALGYDAEFLPAPGLYARPMDELIDTLNLHGVRAEKKDGKICTSGQLTGGIYSIPGNISSQYISGLLFALPLLKEDSELHIHGNTESAAYIGMTLEALEKSGIRITKTSYGYMIFGNQEYDVPGGTVVESDWSNAAFFLCMGALSESGISVKGMKSDSIQGDRAIEGILHGFGAVMEYSEDEIFIRKGNMKGMTVDAAEIPDLIPAISAMAACIGGTTRIINAARLRFKESDRLKSTAAMLNGLGAEVEELEDGLVIHGKEKLSGGNVNPVNDHRIAMSAAVAASSCINAVTVNDAQCVEKSYPDFWKHLADLKVI